MKLIIFDIDGVIINNDNIENNIIYSINKLKERDIEFTFATGRGFLRLEDIFSFIRPKVPIIIEDGSKIVDIIGNKLVSHPMPSNLIYGLKEILNVNELVFATFSEFYTNQYFYLVKDNKIIKEIETVKKYYCNKVTNSIDEFINWAINSKCTKVTLKLNSVIADYNFSQFETNLSEKNLLGITDRKINKAKGIIDLVNILGISLNDIIYIGNDYNDISVFKLKIGKKVAVIDECPIELIELSTDKVYSKDLPSLINNI